jgi:hypothetical protein
MADEGGEITAKGNYKAPMSVSSGGTRPGDVLFAPCPGRLLDGASLAPSLHGRERHRLPSHEGNEYGENPGCRMFLHCLPG